MQVDGPSPWRFATLMAAPHRLSFFTAACVMSGAAAWWWVEMLARSGLWPSLATAVPATFVHAVVMSLGFMPLFFTGFLFTAGPKWLQMGEVPARAIAPGVLTMGAGWLGLLCGSHLNPLLASAGVLAAALGWAMLSWRFIGLVRRSPARDRLHAKLIAAACSLGVVAMLSASVGVALGEYRVIHLAALLGLWWFIVPVYVTVAHRMIPFFTASALPVLDAWRPNWLLWTLLGLVALQGCWVAGEALGWQGPLVTALRVAASSASGALVMGLAVRWGLVQSLRIRLLAMLHIGFVWLGLAFCLDAVATIWGAVGGVQLDLFPLHALTMGFLGSVLIAMVTRVSCGHSGRTLTADNIAWGLFWGLQLTVLLRLAAVWWPSSYHSLLMAAATMWLVVMGAWSLRYGRWYGQPRVDGRSG